MLKKVFSVVLAVVLSLSCFGGSVYALETTNEASTRAKYAEEGISILTITGTTAKCYSFANSISSVTSIVINQTLQKKTSSGTWQFVEHWNGTVTGNLGSIVNYKYNLSSGTYRLKSDFTFLTSSGFEQITVYSTEQ